jgi:lipopolysaccharide export system protein LptC
MATLGRWGVPAALLAAAGTSGWMLYNLDFDAPVTAQRPSDAPDAYMENFVTIEMDGAGKPKRRIEADYMAYHADETVELSNPRYVLYRAEGEPWHVRSERGQVSADGTVVLLMGKVDIWRNDASGARALDIRTEHLKVLPESEYGETEEPVTIRTPAGTSTGVGMRAYLDETRFQLLSQVRTHVDRRRPQL